MEVALGKREDELMAEDTKERMELGKLAAGLLIEQGFIHLCFHAHGLLLY
jgi:hypothetical protein